MMLMTFWHRWGFEMKVNAQVEIDWLISQAKAAMCQVKANGGNSVLIYDSILQVNYQAKFQLEKRKYMELVIERPAL